MVFLAFWVPLGSLFNFQGPYFQCFGFNRKKSFSSGKKKSFSPGKEKSLSLGKEKGSKSGKEVSKRAFDGGQGSGSSGTHVKKKRSGPIMPSQMEV